MPCPTTSSWCPFMAGDNVGHLFWDDFYPIFRVLRQWNMLSSSSSSPNAHHHPYQWLLLRQKLPTALYATCDIRRKKTSAMSAQFCTILVRHGSGPHHVFFFPTSRTVRWNTIAASTTSTASSTALVCARTGVAGLGLWTDHGMADHGWETWWWLSKNNNRVVVVPHNLGHGRDFYAFRQHILDNVLLLLPHGSASRSVTTTTTTTPGVFSRVFQGLGPSFEFHASPGCLATSQLGGRRASAPSVGTYLPGTVAIGTHDRHSGHRLRGRLHDGHLFAPGSFAGSLLQSRWWLRLRARCPQPLAGAAGLGLAQPRGVSFASPLVAHSFCGKRI